MKSLSRRALLRAGLVAAGLIPILNWEARGFAHKKKRRGKSKSPQIMALEAKAKDGDPNAQFSLATSYEQGKGVGKNKKTAIDWYYKAGENFLRKKDRKKAEAALAAITRLSPGHALSIKLGKKLKKK